MMMVLRRYSLLSCSGVATNLVAPCPPSLHVPMLPENGSSTERAL